MSKSLVAITGANSGVGLAMAKRFSSIGFATLLMDLNVDQVESLNLPNSMCIEVDVTQALAMESAINKATNQFGPVDCLINNAGVLYLESITSQPKEHWNTMMSVNVSGVLHGIQSVLSSMVERRQGTIINMGSLGAHKHLDNHGVYNASKAAIHSLSETLRQEVSAYNVRVSVIAPGAIDTNLVERSTNAAMIEGHKKYVSSIDGALSPDDIAKLALSIYELPQQVCLREVVVASTLQQV